MKALVCLSGGLDSTVSFYWALKNYSSVEVMFFNYGQKAYKSEKKTVLELCEKHNSVFQEVDLSFIGNWSGSSLTTAEQKIPTDQVDIASLKASEESAKSVWVSNRNGVMLNVAASYAEASEASAIVLGFNKEEAATFPDNSLDFLNVSNEALKFSTLNKVKLIAPTIDLNKKEIVKMGKDLGIDFDKVWPCYFSGEKICEDCESCQRYLRAFNDEN